MSRFRNFLKNSKEMQLFPLQTKKIATFSEIIVGLAKYTLIALKLGLLGSQTSVVDLK